jgi:hypothetical protein
LACQRAFCGTFSKSFRENPFYVGFDFGVRRFASQLLGEGFVNGHFHNPSASPDRYRSVVDATGKATIARAEFFATLTTPNLCELKGFFRQALRLQPCSTAGGNLCRRAKPRLTAEVGAFHLRRMEGRES